MAGVWCIGRASGLSDVNLGWCSARSQQTLQHVQSLQGALLFIHKWRRVADEFIVGFGVTYALMFVATALRLRHRHRRGQLWWDDFWVVVALVFTVFTAVITLIWVHYSEGRKIHESP